MPTQWVNDRNRERREDDERGFADARRRMAESLAENQAEAEAFGERELEETGQVVTAPEHPTGEHHDRRRPGGRTD